MLHRANEAAAEVIIISSIISGQSVGAHPDIFNLFQTLFQREFNPF